MRSPTGTIPLIVAITPLACSQADRSQPLPASAADVDVVTYTEFPPAEAARWALPEEPLLSIGVVDGDPEYQFSRIAAVVPFRDGVLVADGGSGEVRSFDARGEHLATVGGAGEGPGEFAQLRGLYVVHGDTVLAWDLRTRRVTLFDADLSLIDTRQVAPDQLHVVWGAFHDGDLLVWPFHIMPPEPRSPRLVEGTSFFAVASLTDPTALDTILGFTSRLSWATGDAIFTVPFTQPPAVTAGPVHVWGGNGSDGSVARYDRSGTKGLEIVLPPGGEVTQSAIDEYVASAVETFADMGRRDIEEIYAEMPIPQRFPAFGHVLADDDGNVWVRAYPETDDEAHRWAVFDESGAPLGGLELPRAYTLHTIRRNMLYGVWRDELGVETVRLYRIAPG